MDDTVTNGKPSLKPSGYLFWVFFAFVESCHWLKWGKVKLRNLRFLFDIDAPKPKFSTAGGVVKALKFQKLAFVIYDANPAGQQSLGQLLSMIWLYYFQANFNQTERNWVLIDKHNYTTSDGQLKETNMLNQMTNDYYKATKKSPLLSLGFLSRVEL